MHITINNSLTNQPILVFPSEEIIPTFPTLHDLIPTCCNPGPIKYRSVTYAKERTIKRLTFEEALPHLMRLSIKGKCLNSPDSLTPSTSTQQDASEKAITHKARMKKGYVNYCDGQKIYACPDCPKTFKNSGGVSRHRRLIHKYLSGKQPASLTEKSCYTCESCHKTFSIKHLFIAHTYIHPQKYPHQCLYCVKAYKHLSSLTIHRRLCHPESVANTSSNP